MLMLNGPWTTIKERSTPQFGLEVDGDVCWGVSESGLNVDDDVC